MHPRYNDNSFNCGNVLGFFRDENLKIQACQYDDQMMSYQLTKDCINLTWEEIEQSKSEFSKITLELGKDNIDYCLPQLLSANICKLSLHMIYEQTEEFLLYTIEDEVIRVSNTLFRCNGCEIDHCSQLQHACITTSELEKYNGRKSTIFSALNLKKIKEKAMFLSDRGCLLQYGL